VKPWVKYSIVRLGVFLVALVVLVLLLPNPYLATLIAAVSYLFFAPLRRQVALELAERRSKPEPLDGDSLAEDAELAERDARDDEAARDERDAGRASSPDAGRTS
jgi:hypothetical protein